MTDEQITIGSLYQTREALEELLLQALQSDVNSAANEWGLQAIAKARFVLGGRWTPAPQKTGGGE